MRRYLPLRQGDLVHRLQRLREHPSWTCHGLLQFLASLSRCVPYVPYGLFAGVGEMAEHHAPVLGEGLPHDVLLLHQAVDETRRRRQRHVEFRGDVTHAPRSTDVEEYQNLRLRHGDVEREKATRHGRQQQAEQGVGERENVIHQLSLPLRFRHGFLLRFGTILETS
jgi:hypothetical protein